jgi:hypothetical protein
MSRVLSALAAAALLAPATAALAGDSYTTRIEPRPVYGATITVEAGVRVWRPLPPEGHVIINPSRGPLSLNYYDPATGTYLAPYGRR